MNTHNLSQSELGVHATAATVDVKSKPSNFNSTFRNFDTIFSVASSAKLETTRPVFSTKSPNFDVGHFSIIEPSISFTYSQESLSRIFSISSPAAATGFWILLIPSLILQSFLIFPNRLASSISSNDGFSCPKTDANIDINTRVNRILYSYANILQRENGKADLKFRINTCDSCSRSRQFRY